MRLKKTVTALVLSMCGVVALAANDPYTNKAKELKYKTDSLIMDSQPKTIRFSGLFADVDQQTHANEVLTYSIDIDLKKIATVTQPKGNAAEEFLFTPLPGAVGIAQVKIVVNDVVKASSPKEVSFTIEVNVIRPDLIGLDDISLVGSDVQKKIPLIEKFNRVGGIKDVEVSSSETDKGTPVIKDVIFENNSDKTLHIILTRNEGTAVVTVKGKKMNGDAITDSFNVTVKSNDRLKKFNHDKNSIVWLELGVQNMPDYIDGENQGFSKSREFGRFNYNERLPFAGSSCTTWVLCNSGDWGVSMAMSSKPIFNKDGEDGTGAKVPNEFNDIANTIDVSIYRNWNLYEGSNWMAGFSAGAVNREKVSDNLDRLNYHYGIGFNYRSPLRSYKGDAPSNEIPSTYLSFQYSRVEDYGGFDVSKYNNRFISEFRYRIPETAVQLVFESNAGKGPDEIYVGASILFNPSHLVKMFGVEL